MQKRFSESAFTAVVSVRSRVLIIPTAAAVWEVELKIDGLRAGSYWVTTGLPLPRGKTSDTEELHLVDAAGIAAPLQGSVSLTWPDDSIRWLLLDFSGAASNGSSGWLLRDEEGKKRPSGPVSALETLKNRVWW